MWNKEIKITSESAPLSAPGHTNETNSWQRLWTTNEHIWHWNPWTPKPLCFRSETIKIFKKRLVGSSYLPNEIFTVAAECWLLKKSWHKLMILDQSNCLLSDRTATCKLVQVMLASFIPFFLFLNTAGLTFYKRHFWET